MHDFGINGLMRKKCVQFWISLVKNVPVCRDKPVYGVSDQHYVEVRPTRAVRQPMLAVQLAGVIYCYISTDVWTKLQ